MEIGVLGTGSVGQTLATKLLSLGHSVRLGSRSADNEKAAAWVAQAGETAGHGTFADTAAFGELLFNCTAGGGSLDALRAAGEENLAGKVLVDVANPLDFSRGMRPGSARRGCRCSKRKSARATEGYLPLWLRLMGALGTGHFNIRAVQ